MTDDVAEMQARREALGNPLARLERMMEIRSVETRLQVLFNEGLIRGSTHLSNGQEAVCVGIASSIRPDDWVTCTYRGHGIALALGMTPTAVIGEIAGRTSGCIGGLGGSMHLCAPEIGLLPTFAIVGAGYPVATGAGLTAKMRGTDQVAVAICGDGATNIGAFHESLNLAAVWNLPVVFVIENNLYGEYSPLLSTTPVRDLAVRASAYNMPSEIIDGQQVTDVMDAMTRAVLRARQGEGPTLLEFKTYRYSGHSRSDQATYRPTGELEQWLARDPISLYAEMLAVEMDTDVEILLELHLSVEHRVEECVEAALAAPEPPLRDLFAFTAAEPLLRVL